MTYYHTKYSSGPRKQRSKFSRFIYILIVIAFIIALAAAYQLYVVIFKANTWTKGEDKTTIYVHTGCSYDELKSILYGEGIVVNRKTFDWLANKKNLPSHFKPGKYTIFNGMNNNDLINLLRSGDQVPVHLIFNNIRTSEELANKISTQIEADSLQLIQLLKDSIYLRKFGMNPETALSLFIPNTYEVYWNVNPRDLFDRMYKEYNTFWNSSRLEQCEAIGLTPTEVNILASIIEKETTKNDEKSTMAGVYRNRIKYKWRLQADPTVVYAWGDFSIRRVLNLHKQIDSPYNTYMYYGLPPGPICIPSIASVDAILNLEDHTYMYFCAKDDFSGYHVFSSTHAGHVINANKYRRALDERNIRN